MADRPIRTGAKSRIAELEAQVDALKIANSQLAAALLGYMLVLSDDGPREKADLMAGIRAADDASRALLIKLGVISP